MTVDPISDENEQPYTRKNRPSLGERVRSFARRWTGRLAPSDDETERKPLRTTQKVSAAAIAVVALGFWVVLLYLIVT